MASPTICPTWSGERRLGPAADQVWKAVSALAPEPAISDPMEVVEQRRNPIGLRLEAMAVEEAAHDRAEQAEQAERTRLRAQIEQALGEHDPIMLARLRRDRWGPRALEEASAAISRNLARAEVVRADPASADPAMGDEFYLIDQTEGLEAAMISGLARDRDYWEGKLRWLPALQEDPEDPVEPLVQ